MLWLAKKAFFGHVPIPLVHIDTSYMIPEMIEHRDKLLVRALILEEVPKLFEHLISDVGFLGEQVVSDVEDSVVDIYQEHAKDYLEEIAEMAAGG